MSHHRSVVNLLIVRQPTANCAKDASVVIIQTPQNSLLALVNGTPSSLFSIPSFNNRHHVRIANFVRVKRRQKQILGVNSSRDSASNRLCCQGSCVRVPNR